MLRPKRSFRPRISFAFLAAVLCFFPRIVSASIIYIDFNNNPEERDQIVKSVLASKGPRVMMIPAEDRQQALNLENLINRRDDFFVQYTKNACSAEMVCQAVPSGKCHDIYGNLKTFETAALQAPKTAMNSENLREALGRFSVALLNKQAALNQKNKNKKNIGVINAVSEPITVILSGHYGGGNFTGNLGSLTVKEIKSVFGEFPILRDRVNQLFLLGCYTNTFPQVKSVWRDAFPQARVMIGFYSQSPRGESKPNLQFIDYLIQNRRAFLTIKSKEDFLKARANLKPYHDLNLALTVDDFYEEVNSPDLQLVSQQDQNAVSCKVNLTPEDLSYYAGIKSGDQPVPKITNDSELRTYYSSLRNNATCLDNPAFTSIEPDVPNPDQVIRLILYRNVLANFNQLHAQDLANFDQLLTSLGVEPELQAHSIDFSDRKRLIKWVKDLQTRAGTIADRDSVNNVLASVKNLSDTLVDLNDFCVPFSWVEPGSQEVSQCFRVAGRCGDKADPVSADDPETVQKSIQPISGAKTANLLVKDNGVAKP